MKSRSAITAAGLLLAAVASAATPVGTWTGKFLIKMPVLPPTMPTPQRTKILGMLNEMKAGKLILTMKADKTYTMTAVGMPSFPKSVNKGVWSQTGDTVNVTDAKPGSKAQAFKMSKDGRSMVYTLPADKGAMRFTR